MNPHQVTKDFERALCEYTGAPYAVTTTSCTMALLLAVRYSLAHRGDDAFLQDADHKTMRPPVEIPKRTYIGVPMSIVHAGGKPTFRDEQWSGLYQLKPLPVWDSARWFSSGMYSPVNGVATTWPLMAGQMLCVSFHWAKTLGIQQGGAILHDNADADRWLRKARFDGRTEGVAPSEDRFDVLGWHAYMSPEVAAEGLMRLANLPKHNNPIPNDPYPDLSTMRIFQ